MEKLALCSKNFYDIELLRLVKELKDKKDELKNLNELYDFEYDKPIIIHSNDDETDELISIFFKNIEKYLYSKMFSIKVGLPEEKFKKIKKYFIKCLIEQLNIYTNYKSKRWVRKIIKHVINELYFNLDILDGIIIIYTRELCDFIYKHIYTILHQDENSLLKSLVYYKCSRCLVTNENKCYSNKIHGNICILCEDELDELGELDELIKN
jgi:hypothetical protein